jgi:hypothetical protein
MIAALPLIAAALGGLVTLWLAVDFARDPGGAMRRATHRPEMLPRVMVGRYAAFTVLAFAAALHGDLGVVMVLFAVFAGICAWDAALYARAGHPWAAHGAAGIGCLIVIALAAAAQAAA